MLGNRSAKQTKNKNDALNEIKKKCNELNFNFIGFEGGEWLGCRNTKLILKCLHCDNISVKNYDNFINKNSGCKFCRDKKAASIIRLSNLEVKSRIKTLCEKYGFIFVKFKNKENKYYNNKTKIILKCIKCNELVEVSCNKFFNRGYFYCIKCNNKSIGEKNIKDFLLKENIIFNEQKTFDWLKYKGFLRLDFYLPQHNIGIEYQGIQHFKPIDYFGGENGFNEQLKRDELKFKLCKEHGIQIKYISYENDINNELNKIING